MVIKEAHNAERKRRQASRKERSEALMAMTQRAKALIADIKRGEIRNEEVQKRLECFFFGRGSRHEIEKATTREKSSKEWKKLPSEKSNLKNGKRRNGMQKEGKEKTEGSTSTWRKNKCFPKQFEGEEDTPDAEETLAFWRTSTTKKQLKGGERTCPSARSSTE